MQTQLWRPNVGIAELGEDNLFHIGKDGLESIMMVLLEIRRGRSLDQRLNLGRRIDGEWAGDWTDTEASVGL
jgi:hypothetical protein